MWATATCVALACFGVAVSASAAFTVGGHGVAPWPYPRLELGVASAPGQAAAQRRAAPFGFRYAYLSGGVNTRTGWTTWANGGGSYVDQYLSESAAAGAVPVFSYYQLRQSRPGVANGDESVGDLGNLRNRATMLAYYDDLKLFFQRAANATGPVVLQVEPDLWGYIEQRSGGDPNAVPAAVASSGMPDLRGLANTARGFAQAIIVLRNNYAPKVILGYHDSIWGTGVNLQSSHPTDTQVAGLAVTSVRFYRALDAHFDAVFAELADRDAGYAQVLDGEGTTQWWAPIDFTHLGTYLDAVHHALGLPIVIWQIPVGTTALPNRSGQYADNKLQTLLSTTPSSRTLLTTYAHAGVAALLFGSGQGNDTPVTGRTLRIMEGYYRAGPLRFARH